MTTNTAGRWLLVALAVVGLALAATAVGAHGNDTTTATPHDATDAAPYDGTAEEREHWMERRMTEHADAGSVDRTGSHVGVTTGETARGVADGDHDHATGHETDGVDDTRDDGVHGDGYGRAGRGHGC